MDAGCYGDDAGTCTAVRWAMKGSLGGISGISEIERWIEARMV